MREILFRGKGCSNGVWYFGFLYKAPNIRSGAEIMWHNNEISSSTSRSVDIKTIGEFTGLTDKNGTNIFEGDILSKEPNTCDSGFDPTFYVVFYDAPSFLMRLRRVGKHIKSVDYDAVYGISTSLEVIGNIHDNPELLEVEK